MNIPKQPDTFRYTLDANHGSAFQLSEQPEISNENQPSNRARYYHHPLGSVALFGDCFASDTVVYDALNSAIVHDQFEALTVLPGSYGAVVQKTDSLHIFSDFAGQVPIYYSSDGSKVTAATQPSSTSMSGSPKLDTDILAAHLLFPGAEGVMFGNETAFKGVHKLDPGVMLSANARNGRLTSQLIKYEHIGGDRGATLQEAAELLRVALLRSVGFRLDQNAPCTSDFTGGFDSTSLTFLAARLGDHNIPAFYLKEADHPSGDERYVDTYSKLDTRIKVRKLLRDISDTPYTLEELMERPWAEDLGLAINAPPLHWRFLSALYKEIGEEAGSIHLTGIGGDEVLSVNPLYLAHLARPQSMGRFLREGMAWARLKNTSAIRVWQAMARYNGIHVDDLYRDVGTKLQSDNLRIDEWDWLSYVSPLSLIAPGATWLTNEARDRLGSRMSDWARNHAEQDICEYAELGGFQCAGMNAANVKNYLRSQGLETVLQTPYLDNDVIRAIRTATPEQKGSPYVFKRILGLALEGLIPDEVLTRTTKGCADASSSSALQQSAPTLYTMGNELLLADLGIIDPDSFRQAVDSIQTASLSSMWSMHRIITAESWLRALDAKGILNRQTPQSESSNLRPVVRIHAEPNKAPRTDEEISNARYHVPSYVYAVSSDIGNLVLFNTRDNTYVPLNLTASHILRALADTGNIEDTIECIRARYAQVNPDQIRSDVLRYTDELKKGGILETAIEPMLRELPIRPGNGVVSFDELATARRDSTRVKLHEQAVAVAGLVTSIALNKFKPNARLPILKFLQDKWTTRDASWEMTHRLLVAEQRIPYLGQLACLQAPFAASLSGALLRRKIPWHQAVSFNPLSFHSYNTVGDSVVQSNLDGRVIGTYHPFF